MSFEKQPPPPLDFITQTGLSQTPLHFACYKGDVEMVNSLLEKAACYNVDEQATRECNRAMIEEEDSINGWTPSHWASFYGQLTCLMKLHDVGPNVGFDKSCVKSNASPLHLAAQSGAVLCLKWLLQCGATIDRQDFMGETALHKAAKAGNTDSAAMLMSHGSALELKNHRGCTPADLAELANHPTLAQLLRRCVEHPNHPESFRIPQPCPLPISDLNMTSPVMHSPFDKGSKRLVEDHSSVFPYHTDQRVNSWDRSNSGVSIQLNGQSIHHSCSSLGSGGHHKFEASSESLSGGNCQSFQNRDAGVSNVCRMKRSLDLDDDEFDDDEEEDMEDFVEAAHPDSKRRCFVSSQDQPPSKKYGDAYNNNVISSYNAVLAMGVGPMRIQCDPMGDAGMRGCPSSPAQSSSTMEHQQSIVAEQGYDSSVMTSFKNVFV